MTKDEITQLARAAGFVGMDGDHGCLRKFAGLVAAAEVRRLTQVAQQALDAIHYWHWTGETPGAHDLLVKAHDALRDALHPAAPGPEMNHDYQDMLADFQRADHKAENRITAGGKAY